MMTLMVALQPDDTIVLQISQDNKALAHVALPRDAALKVAEDIKRLAERIPAPPTSH